MKTSETLSAVVAVVLALGAMNARAATVEIYGKRAQSFELNQGQTDAKVKFLSRGQGYTLYLTANEAVLALTRPEARTGDLAAKSETSAPRTRPGKSILRMSLVDANPTPQVEGMDPLSGKSHYFIGQDPDQWHRNVPNFAKVRYREVYPGVDLIFYGNQQQLEYDFIVAPGAKVSGITMRFQGADAIELEGGDLVLRTPGGEVRLEKPVIYQESDGAREPIDGEFVLKGAGQVAFQVAAYDRDRPLIIDPVLVYATYVGGAADKDRPADIAIDAFGNAYITGRTDSVNYPTTPGSFSERCAGSCDDSDLFVTKLSADGSRLIYSTYIGGFDDERGGSIAVDAMGNAYVVGSSDETFPTTDGAMFTCSFDFSEVFVSKLNEDGSELVYSTCLGMRRSVGLGIEVDSTGSAYVTGEAKITFAFPLPPLPPHVPTTDGAVQPFFGGGLSDAFVVKLNPAGTAFEYATYLGGELEDRGESITVDAEGFAYVSGSTCSVSFPTTPGSYDTTHNGPLNCGTESEPGRGGDAFVTKLNPTGTELIYSTFLGGLHNEIGGGVAVDSAGNAYIVGATSSADFPTVNGFDVPCESTPGFEACQLNAFVTKLDPAGAGLIYSTYLGRLDVDFRSRVASIAIDSFGNAYVSGSTSSENFPTTIDAIQDVAGGDSDGFVMKLGPNGSLLYSTYLGGEQSDGGRGIAVDALGTAYVVMETLSPNSLMTLSPNPDGPFQSVGPGFADANAYVAKIAIGGSTATGTNVVVQPVDAATGQTPVLLTFETVDTAGPTTLEVSDTGPAVSGFSLGDPPTFFEISTDAIETGDIEVCINYSGITFPDEEMLALLHFEVSAWFDVTTSRDPVNDVICGSVTSLSPFAVGTPSATSLMVNIDIQPGSDLNRINPMSRGVVSVAILGSDSFDVRDLDVTTLAFGPAGAPSILPLTNPEVFRSLSRFDFNGDGFKDLVTLFRVQETGIELGDPEACLTGATKDGTAFESCDHITVVPKVRHWWSLR